MITSTIFINNPIRISKFDKYGALIGMNEVNPTLDDTGGWQWVKMINHSNAKSKK